MFYPCRTEKTAVTVHSRCENCMYLQPYGANVVAGLSPLLAGECRRNAPTTVSRIPQRAVWPQVAKGDWCGAFVDKEFVLEGDDEC